MSCSNLQKWSFENPMTPTKKFTIKAATSDEPEHLDKISGQIVIFPKNIQELPYRGIRYRIQLYKAPFNELISEHLTNSDGQFEFQVEPDTQYFLRIYSNQNKALEAFHGPFMAKDTLSISL
jgi:hypothetical protein